MGPQLATRWTNTLLRFQTKVSGELDFQAMVLLLKALVPWDEERSAGSQGVKSLTIPKPIQNTSRIYKFQSAQWHHKISQAQCFLPFSANRTQKKTTKFGLLFETTPWALWDQPWDLQGLVTPMRVLSISTSRLLRRMVKHPNEFAKTEGPPRLLEGNQKGRPLDISNSHDLLPPNILRVWSARFQS